MCLISGFLLVLKWNRYNNKMQNWSIYNWTKISSVMFYYINVSQLMFVVRMWKRHDVSNNHVRCVDIKNDATIRQTGSTYYVVEATALRDFGWFTLILMRDQRKFSKQCVYLKKENNKKI